MKRSQVYCFLGLVSLVLSICATTAFAGETYYVKEGASGNGTNWANAYGTLQAAMNVAISDDEIWVATGTYYPTSDYALGIGDRGKHFRMKNGVAIYGGFAGTETELAQRDVENNETILSGDIGTAGQDWDNCYHVFYHPDGMNLDSSAVLDGFTITAGNADWSFPHDSGGGILNYNSSPTVRGCTFSDNSADYGGG
jgi:hypothetical protein